MSELHDTRTTGIETKIPAGVYSATVRKVHDLGSNRKIDSRWNHEIEVRGGKFELVSPCGFLPVGEFDMVADENSFTLHPAGKLHVAQNAVITAEWHGKSYRTAPH